MIELIYQKPLTDKAKEILREGIRLDLLQEDYKPTIEEAIGYFNQCSINGSHAFVVADGIVFILNRVTPYLGNCHMAIAKGLNFKQIVTSTKEAIEWAWVNTKYNRIETRSPLKFSRVLAKSTGGDLAVVKNSFYKDCKMQDEYIVGWLRENT